MAFPKCLLLGFKLSILYLLKSLPIKRVMKPTKVKNKVRYYETQSSPISRQSF